MLPNITMGRINPLYFLFCLIFNQVYSQDSKYTFSLISPRITSARLLTAWFTDESSGYIAGSDGAVLFTNDSGKTWRECSTPKRTVIVSLFFHDIQNGWAAGGFDGRLYLIETKDGGQSWMEHDIPALAGKVIRKIKFRNRTDGWITGGSKSSGFVYRTGDGGASWVDRSPGDLGIPHHVIEDILIIDSNTVVICGYRGYLARSSDNGLNWQRIAWKSIAPDSLIAAPLEEFQQINNDVIFCKSKEDILRSNDGGVTWKSVFFIGQHGGMQLGGFFFHDAKNGFAIGGYGKKALRFTTKDGGISWEATKDTVGDVTAQIVFPRRGKQGYMVGRGPSIYHIAFLGEDKLQLNTGYTMGSVPTVDFSDGNHGCIGGAPPIGLRKTSDGGSTWKIVDTTADYTGAIIKSNSHFALKNGKRTTDGGATWQQAPDSLWEVLKLYKTAQNDAIYFTQLNESGIGLRLLVTRDLFITWKECQIPVDRGTFFFLNADTGWAASKSLYLTTDGARSWKEVGQFDGIIGAACIYFVDNLHGWAGGVGSSDSRPTTILRTSNGGKTWIPQEKLQYLPDSIYAPNTPFKGRLPTRIYGKNVNEAWFIDGFYCVFHTNDGGIVWRQVALPQKLGAAYLKGTLALAGDGSLFCTGENGMVFRILTNRENGVRFNHHNELKQKKSGFSLMLPFDVPNNQYPCLYDLKGACIKLDNNLYPNKFPRPLFVEKEIERP